MKLLKFFTILLLFILIFSYAISEIYCLDIWLHLKTGEYILKEKEIPKFDPFSYTGQGRVWINHEWLTQVIFSSIYSLFGPNGLIIMRSLIILTTFLLLFLVGYKKENYLIITLFLLAVLNLSEQRFMMRPELWTFLFTSSFLFILNKHRSTKLLYLLPLIQLLWVNMHGYFFIGTVSIFIYIIAETIKRKCALPFEWNKKNTFSEPAYKRLLFAGILIVAASFINPYGWKGALYPVQTLFRFTGEHGIFLTDIYELKPLFTQHKIELPLLAIPWFKVVIIISALSFLINFRKLALGNFALYAISVLMVLRSNRHIAIFSVISFVVTTININELKKTFVRFAGSSRTQEFLKALLSIIPIVYMSAVAFENFNEEYYSFEKGKFKKFCFGVGSFSYPERAIDFIEENGIQGNVFNDFKSGAYFIWRLFPKKKVFIDGRTEVYGPLFYKRYRSAFQDEKSFQDIVSEYDINCILVSFIMNEPPPEDVLKFLHKHPDWVLVYLDDRASVFVKNIGKNKRIIDTFDISKRKPSYTFTESDIAELKRKNVYPYVMIRTALVLEGLALYEKAQEEIEYALRIKPDALKAYKISASSYIGMKDYGTALKRLKEGLTYDPRDVELRRSIGFIYAALGDFENALKQYKGALYFDPSDVSTRYLMGKAYVGRGQYEKAISEFEGILEGKKQRRRVYRRELLSDLYAHLGMAYSRIGKLEESKGAFLKALELNPENEEAKKYLDSKKYKSSHKPSLRGRLRAKREGDRSNL